MTGWWVHHYYQAGGAALLVSWIFWVIFSITMHELAHGWAALWQGDDTPRRYHRMTPNPIVHMGPMSLLMFALIGIAWGLMPTDPSKYRWRRKGRIVVAGAGPAMNILLAFIALTGAAFWTCYGSQRQPLFDNVNLFLFTGGWLNLVLAAFNLLPVPPLDGASVIMGFSFRAYQFYQRPEVQTFGFFIVIVLFMTTLSSVLFRAARGVSHDYVTMLINLLP